MYSKTEAKVITALTITVGAALTVAGVLFFLSLSPIENRSEEILSGVIALGTVVFMGAIALKDKLATRKA